MPASKSAPGVRGAAAGGHGEAAEPLAGDLQLPGRALARLQHERAVRSAREQAKQSRRVGAADLLVRVHEHDGLDKRRQPQLAHCAQRVDDRDQPALHVGHAGPEQHAVLLAHRHASEGADGPDGVHVPDEQLARAAAAALRRPRVQVVTDPWRPHGADGVAGRLQLGGEDTERARLARRIE